MPDPISPKSHGVLSYGTHQSMSRTPTDSGIDSFLNLSIKSRYSWAEYASSRISSSSLAQPWGRRQLTVPGPPVPHLGTNGVFPDTV
jgi:hypothetical protein